MAGLSSANYGLMPMIRTDVPHFWVGLSSPTCGGLVGVGGDVE